MTDLKLNKKSWLSSVMVEFSAIDSLKDHITEHHNGNMAEYARNLSVSPTQVRRWVDMNCIVINGEVWRKAKTTKKVEL
tara:strand:+ start:177 stop:413 length:237 start_codon:yes stop_codon:yes gene_type:complete